MSGTYQLDNILFLENPLEKQWQREQVGTNSLGLPIYSPYWTLDLVFSLSSIGTGTTPSFLMEKWLENNLHTAVLPHPQHGFLATFTNVNIKKVDFAFTEYERDTWVGSVQLSLTHLDVANAIVITNQQKWTYYNQEQCEDNKIIYPRGQILVNGYSSSNTWNFSDGNSGDEFTSRGLYIVGSGNLCMTYDLIIPEGSTSAVISGGCQAYLKVPGKAYSFDIYYEGEWHYWHGTGIGYSTEQIHPMSPFSLTFPVSAIGFRVKATAYYDYQSTFVGLDNLTINCV